MTRPELWTAPAAGGVAVIVLRGPGGMACARRLGVRDLPPGAAPRLVRLSAAGEDLDEALVLRPAADRLELHVHGSPPLVERVLAILRDAPPARDLAPPMDRDDGAGELVRGVSERAWLRLGDAPGELAARILLDQAQGAFEAEVRRMRGLEPAPCLAALEALLAEGRRARLLLVRTTVALVGPVNAGKSTLFNRLVGSERAVVSPEAGTTRDAITEEVRLGPWPLLLVDTAGQRELPAVGREHALERAGQRLARAVGSEADWVLRLARAGERGAAPPAPQSASELLLTCCDVATADPTRWPAGGISALLEPEHARERVRALFEARFGLSAEPERLWRAGRAVPFEDAQLEGLERLVQAARGLATRPSRSGPEGHPGAAIDRQLEALLR